MKQGKKVGIKNQVILLQKEEEFLLSNPSKKGNTLALIPSNLCITHTFEPSEENPLLKAYQDKLLQKEQSYLSFSFSSKLQNNLLCFFAPCLLLSNSKFAMLDLSLPTQIQLPSLCTLFIYPSHSLLCFYQNQSLQYCKTLLHQEEDIALCKSYLSTLFEYDQPLYALSYLHPLPKALHSLDLIPLSSLFISSSPDFGLHFEKLPISNHQAIISLTPPPSQALNLLKFMFFSLALFALSTFAFCSLTHSPPQESNDTRSLQILSTLQSLPSNQPLFLLLQTLSKNLGNHPLLEIELYDQKLKLIFKSQIPQELVGTLSKKGYALKTLDPSTLEIAL